MLSVNKCISKALPSQVILRNPIPSSEVTLNPQQFFRERLTKSEKAIFNYLLVWSNTYRSLYFRQDTIARAVGCTRVTVNRAINTFVRHGLIASFYRSTKKKFSSSVYTISSWFRNMEVRESLRHIFNAFVCFPVALLMMASTPVTGQNVTRYRESIYISNQVSICKAGMPGYPPYHERNIYPTRVEMVESWKPAGSILPADDPFRSITTQAEVFQDPRLNRNSSVSGYGNKYPQKQAEVTGSKKSNLTVYKQQSSQERSRREGEHQDWLRSKWQKETAQSLLDQLEKTNELGIEWRIYCMKGMMASWNKYRPGEAFPLSMDVGSKIEIAVDPDRELATLTEAEIRLNMNAIDSSKHQSFFQAIVRAKNKYPQLAHEAQKKSG